MQSRSLAGTSPIERARASVVDERRARSRVLHRVLEFSGVTIHDVVNCPRAKARVLGFFRVADASSWEDRRTHLRLRAEHERWVRNNV